MGKKRGVSRRTALKLGLAAAAGIAVSSRLDLLQSLASPAVGSLQWLALQSNKPTVIRDMENNTVYPFSFNYNGQPWTGQFLLNSSVSFSVQSSLTERLTSVTWTESQGAGPLRVTCQYKEFTDDSRYANDALEWILYFENILSSGNNTSLIQNVNAMDISLTSPIGIPPTYSLHRTSGDNFYPDSLMKPPPPEQQFRASTSTLMQGGTPQSFGGYVGWSSWKEFPYYKVDTSSGAFITAVGWSGQWFGKTEVLPTNMLHLTAGMGSPGANGAVTYNTSFVLMPGENGLGLGGRVRSPRILIHYWKAPLMSPDPLESNALFRQLIAAHYVRKWTPPGQPFTPVTLPALVQVLDSQLFSSEHDGPNQPTFGQWCERNWQLNDDVTHLHHGDVDVLRSFVQPNAPRNPIPLDAFVQDATWYQGPESNPCQNGDLYLDEGQWDLRTCSFPAGTGGLGPISDLASQQHVTNGHGLWWEPESAEDGTAVTLAGLVRLTPRPNSAQSNLADFGLADTYTWFLTKVQSTMQGSPAYAHPLKIYRQDSNRDEGAPNDPGNLITMLQLGELPNATRLGIGEMRHFAGMYAFLDAIPSGPNGQIDALMEGCSGGGRRLDLEAIMHFHFHQWSDGGYDNTNAQIMTWGLSQYLPNSVFKSFINLVHGAPGYQYTFDTRLDSSKCLIMDPTGLNAVSDAEFNLVQGYFVNRHNLIKGLISAAWYPLLPQLPAGGADPSTVWAVSQYHNPAPAPTAIREHGCIVAFRREHAPLATQVIQLHGLIPTQNYLLTAVDSGFQMTMSGAYWMTTGFTLEIDTTPGSTLVTVAPV